MPDAGSEQQSQLGGIVDVRGGIVDVRFSRLPAVNHALEVIAAPTAILETVTHPNAEVVSAMALTPTQGLFRGAPVRDTGGQCC